jgi:hypothetical protein
LHALNSPSLREGAEDAAKACQKSRDKDQEVPWKLAIHAITSTGRSNTGDKLRSSNTLGFVCFIPLFAGIAVGPSHPF